MRVQIEPQSYRPRPRRTPDCTPWSELKNMKRNRMPMTSSIIGVVFDSVVNNLDISVLKAAKKTNIMAITNALKAIVSLEYFLALSIFP